MPVQGTGVIGVTTDASGNVIPIITSGNTTGSNDFGGRIIRILPDGTLNEFAYGFDTNGAQDSSSFINSMLSISFSATGTTLYASDDDGHLAVQDDCGPGELDERNACRTERPYARSVCPTTAGTARSRSSIPVSTRCRLRSRAGSRRGSTCSPADWEIRTWQRRPRPRRSTTAAGVETEATGTLGNSLQNTFSGHGTPVAGVIAQFVPQATLVPVNIFLPFNAGVILSQSGTNGAGGGGGGAGGGGGGGGGGGTGGSSTLSGTSNALSSSQLVYNGLQYVVQHPFVIDPLRPGKVDRVIAASFGFGSTQTFQTEVDAYRNYPQVVIAFKNAYHKFLKEGIAPIAASGQFGAPLGAGAPGTTAGGGAGGGGGGTGGAAGLIFQGNNNADNSSLGDVNGMSLPAVLNEVISVTGVFSFPYDQNATSTPVDQIDGVIPNPLGPILLFGNSLTIGGTATATNGTGGAAEEEAELAEGELVVVVVAAPRPASMPMPSCSRLVTSQSMPTGSRRA